MQKGFTLAEVLITLGIIGVVAAMTLPTIIANAEKQTTIAQLKKVYTTLSQAVKLSEVENEALEHWNFNQPVNDFFNQYLKKYMPSIVDMRYGVIWNTTRYTRPNGTIENNFTIFNSNTEIISLKDGTLLYLDLYLPSTTNPRQDRSIFVDINGTKGPNKIGHDFFGFAISKTKGVVPYGAYGAADQPMAEFSRDAARSGTYACTKQGRGMFCAALIMIDGWQIADDYPW